jgi:hypothetical protein
MSWNLEKITHSWVKEAFNKEKVQHPPSILVFSETVFKPPLGGLGAKNGGLSLTSFGLILWGSSPKKKPRYASHSYGFFVSIPPPRKRASD